LSTAALREDEVTAGLDSSVLVVATPDLQSLVQLECAAARQPQVPRSQLAALAELAEVALTDLQEVGEAFSTTTSMNFFPEEEALFLCLTSCHRSQEH